MINKEYVMDNIGSENVYLYKDIKEIIDELHIENNCNDDDFIALELAIEHNSDTLEKETVIRCLGKREYEPKELVIKYGTQMFIEPIRGRCERIVRQALNEYKRAYTILAQFADEVGTEVITICEMATYYLELLLTADGVYKLINYKRTHKTLCYLEDLYRDYKEYLEV